MWDLIDDCLCFSDTLQNRVTKIIYPNTAPVSSPSPPSTVLPNTESPKSQKASESAKPDREKGKGKKKQYHKLSITNSYDNKIRSQLDEADALFEKVLMKFCTLSAYGTSGICAASKFIHVY